ncbi:hypothetical protein EBI_25943 [Enterocytozoon bieneusi H348]|nr:hypothetical protein EBI_25943 [Enterocytozoon bieneusi H348]|eukprot:XP_002651027.1 hypothetical protein EBI_25943 [Enterocytozoon bieneusi H348]
MKKNPFFFVVNTGEKKGVFVGRNPPLFWGENRGF